MIDESSGEVLRVQGDREAPGLIMAPVSQLNTVLRILAEHHIPYWVDEEYISLDGEPDVAFINISREVDPEWVQEILNAAA